MHQSAAIHSVFGLQETPTAAAAGPCCEGLPALPPPPVLHSAHTQSAVVNDMAVFNDDKLHDMNHHLQHSRLALRPTVHHLKTLDVLRQ